MVWGKGARQNPRRNGREATVRVERRCTVDGLVPTRQMSSRNWCVISGDLRINCLGVLPWSSRNCATALVARYPHLYQRDVENIVDAILGEIADALARYDRVELRGFESGARRARDATC